MILLITSFLILISIINLKISKNFLYPPFIYCSIWSFYMTIYYIISDIFYPIASVTLLVYFMGASFFSIGGYIGLKYNIKYLCKNNSINIDSTTRFIYFLLILETFAYPFYFKFATENSINFDLNFFADKRSREVLLEENYNIFGNFAVLMPFISSSIYLLYKQLKFGTLLFIYSVILSILYLIMTGAKQGIIGYIFTLVFVKLIKEKKFNIKYLFAISLLIISVFILGIFIINFNYYSIDGYSDVFYTVVSYIISPIVAFNDIVLNPNYIESAHDLFRSFYIFANYFGFHFQIPSIHFEFTETSPILPSSNTYTIYSSYFMTFGYFGIVICPLILGFFLSINYLYALNNNFTALMMYCIFSTGLVFSVHGEQFLLALNPILKAYIFYFIMSKFIYEK